MKIQLQLLSVKLRIGLFKNTYLYRNVKKLRNTAAKNKITLKAPNNTSTIPFHPMYV